MRGGEARPRCDDARRGGLERCGLAYRHGQFGMQAISRPAAGCHFTTPSRQWMASSKRDPARHSVSAREKIGATHRMVEGRGEKVHARHRYV